MSQVLNDYQAQLAEEKIPAGKKKVLQAALKLFANNGFHATTTAKIAKQAGVSEGTIYKYFRSKDDLLAALLHPLLNDIKNSFFHNIDQFDTLSDLIHFAVHDRVEFVTINFDLFRLVFQSALTNQFSPDFYHNLLDDNNPADRFKQMQQKFPEINQNFTAAQIARAFIGPLMAFVLQVQLLSIPATANDQSLIEAQIMANLTMKTP